MNRQAQFRTFQTSVRLREENGSPPMLFGHAALFNSPSQDLGGFTEVLARGCFAETIAGNDIRAFFNHCHDHLLGRNKSGTLRLWEDAAGLAFELDVDETTIGRDVYRMVKRGDLDGMSFGFYAIEDEWSPDGKVNTVRKAELIEISPVVFPAYLGTKVDARCRSMDPERLARRPKSRFPRLERARRIVRLDDDR